MFHLQNCITSFEVKSYFQPLKIRCLETLLLPLLLLYIVDQLIRRLLAVCEGLVLLEITASFRGASAAQDEKYL